MTKKEAIALAKTRWWEKIPAKEAALFQLNEPVLCMDFPVFHALMEKALGRPVYTHEFGGDLWSLRRALEGTPLRTVEYLREVAR